MDNIGQIKGPEIRVFNREFRRMGLFIRKELVGVEFEGELTWKSVEEGLDVKPCMRLTETAAQQLMDDLWTCGIRPTEGSGSAGALAAVQNHLEDFKTLLYHQMKIARK